MPDRRAQPPDPCQCGAENSTYCGLAKDWRRNQNPLLLLVQKGRPLATTQAEPDQETAPAMEDTRISGVPALRRPPSPTAPKRRWGLWAIAAVVGIGLAGFAASQIWMSGPPLAAVEIAALAPVTRVLAVNGQVTAARSVEMKPLVTGTITAVPVAEGDQVLAQQILVQIDTAAQNAIVRQAVAALDAATVNREQATEAYDRAVSLGANLAKTARDVDANALALATQEVARQTAALDQALVGLENHSLRAPVAGTILSLDAQLGQLVNPATSLLTLADLGSLLVEADVDEAYATQITTGLPAILRLAGEASNRDGHVSFVSARVDATTGGLAIKMAFDAPVIAPVGLTVTANIIVEQNNAALSVPRTALRETADGKAVFVIHEGKAKLQSVEVVDWPAARLIVTAGLSEGDTVITDATGIEDGQSIAAEQP